MAQFDEVIPPGQEGTITLEVSGEKVTGQFRKNATVHSNDPDHPQLTISLAGKILQYVDVGPSNRVYLRGMFGEQVSKEITVSSTEMKGDLEVLDVTSNIDDKITYKVLPDPEPGHYAIRIYKNPKLPTLNTWGSLTIKTNSEKSPDKIVQVNVTTRGAIMVQPSTLNFGTVAGPDAVEPETNEFERSVFVFKANGEFHIEEVTFSGEGYTADIEPVEDGKRYKVTVRFSPSVVRKSYVDEMIINTDDPQEPSVRVRLLARGA